jgi:hypothetical protein
LGLPPTLRVFFASRTSSIYVVGVRPCAPTSATVAEGGPSASHKRPTVAIGFDRAENAPAHPFVIKNTELILHQERMQIKHMQACAPGSIEANRRAP